jgi:hypothetical protein
MTLPPRLVSSRSQRDRVSWHHKIRCPKNRRPEWRTGWYDVQRMSNDDPARIFSFGPAIDHFAEVIKVELRNIVAPLPSQINLRSVCFVIVNAYNESRVFSVPFRIN